MLTRAESKGLTDKVSITTFVIKTGEVNVNRNTNLPMATMPGVRSIDLYRPNTRLWEQPFLGLLADGNISENVGTPSPKGGIEAITLETKRTIYTVRGCNVPVYINFLSTKGDWINLTVKRQELNKGRH